MTKHGANNRRLPSAGFTLVEVLVALFIIGVAIPALLTQVMTQVDGSAALRDQMVAQWVAENQLARLQLQRRMGGQAFKGKDSGEETMAGAEWQWQVESTDTVVDGLLRYDITVGRGEETELALLTAFIDE